MMPPAKIFVVEDETLIAMELQDRLTKLGYAVCGISPNGEAALSAIAANKPNLILMDIHLAGNMDGIEVATRLRAADIEIPVLFLTAYSDEETISRVVATDPFGYLVKPFEERELHTTIQAALKKHQLETALRDANRRIAVSAQEIDELIEFGPDALILTNREGRMTMANRLTTEMFGWSREELIGQPIEMLIPKPLRDIHVRLRDRHWLHGKARAVMGANRSDLMAVRMDGSEFPVEVSLATINTTGGQRVAAAIRDVTERRELEQRLSQAVKLEAVGRLTGGMAHDFNNLLAVILGSSELLVEPLGETNVQLRSIIRAATRGAELTQRMLAFSRKQPLRPQSIKVGTLVHDISDMLARTVGETIEMNIDTTGDVWNAQADPGQVESALLNLALNARDAMGAGGTLTIRCTTATVHAEEPQAEVEIEPGDYVLLEVTDTGMGMSPEVQTLAFEPFFTTKDVGKGSGLGLPMVYGFAKQSGGTLTIESKLGHGTTVRMYLPRAADMPTIDDQKRGADSPHGAGETILVIEDDPDVRDLAVAMLESLNYVPIEAQDATAARARVEEAGHIDLVLSDVVLPGGTSGPEFAEEMASLRPDLKFAFMSGYSGETIKRGEIPKSKFVLLGKPFKRKELALALREALRRPRQ